MLEFSVKTSSGTAIPANARRGRLGSRGYTLVEILAVVAVSSILLSIALPRVRPALDRARVNSAANVVASDMQYAQLMAVQSRRPVAIIVNMGTRQYVIRDRDNPGITYRLRSLGDESEYRLEEVRPSMSSNELFPNGLARQSWNFVLRLHDYSRTVTISRAGQVRISS